MILVILLGALSACGARLGSNTPTSGSYEDVTYGTPNASSVPRQAPTESQAAAELVTVGVRKEKVPEYKVPKPVREKLKQIDPSLVPEASETFQVYNQFLDIDSKHSKVTFSGVLRIEGKKDEGFELSCAIDTNDTPWVCTDMVPTNATVAAEKRLQASFKCLDTYRCDKVGVELFVVIDGKLQEPQLFQAEGFHVQRLSSGDVEELPQAVTSPNVSTPPAPKTDARINLPGGEDNTDDELSAAQVETILDQPDGAVEVTEPMRLPPPTPGRFSIPGIERLQTAIGVQVKNQAIGTHNSGYLKSPAELPAQGLGFISRDHGSKDFGTDLTIGLLAQALGQVAKSYPESAPIVIASVANRSGGTLYNRSGGIHKSHETGLDADVGLPSKHRTADLWPACTVVSSHTKGGGHVCQPGGRISPDLDDAKLWMFLKSVTCAANDPVLAIFLDRALKQHVCKYALSLPENASQAGSCAFKTLRALHHVTGHYDHVHIRFRCPGNRDCQNSIVSLGNSTGC